jgi:hypothetical protein
VHGGNSSDRTPAKPSDIPPSEFKPADSILWYHTVLGWIDQWVKPTPAEYEKQLSSGVLSGTRALGTTARR